MYLFLYAPIISLAVFSFNDSKSMAKWNGFSLRWYKQLLENDRILDALYYTIVIAIVAAVIATIIGTITSIGIHNMRNGKVRGLLLNINYLPVLNPDIVTGVALMSLYVFIKLGFGFTTMLL